MNIYRIAGVGGKSNWMLSRIWSQIEETLEFVCVDVQVHRHRFCRECGVCTDPLGVFVCRCAHIPAGQTLVIISVFNRKACAVSHQPRSLLWSEGCCQLLGVVLEALWAVHIKMITQACFCIIRMFKPSSSVKLVFCFALPRWNPPWKSQFSNWSGSLYRASGPSV